MKRGRKKHEAEQMALPAGASSGGGPVRETGAASVVSSLVEYREPKRGDPYRVERWDLLSAEFGMQVEDLPRMHIALAEGLGPMVRGWQVVRRLFGIVPVLPPSTANLDDLRVWGREELADALGITVDQVRQEVDAVRAFVARAIGRQDPEAKDPVLDYGGELAFRDEKVLERFGFPESMFHVMGRDAEEGRMEKAWFAQRVADWGKMLEHKMAGTLARQALLNELRLRRGEIELMKVNSATEDGEREYTRRLKRNQELETAYQTQLSQLDEIFPWMGAVAGKASFHGVLSDLVRGYQEHQSLGTNALFDGVMSAIEVQVELRASKQMPEARYRLGLVAWVNAARAGLWDPHWRPCFTAAQLRKLDEGFKEGVRRAMEADGETLPDLEGEGPESEYGELVVPAKDEG